MMISSKNWLILGCAGSTDGKKEAEAFYEEFDVYIVLNFDKSISCIDETNVEVVSLWQPTQIFV